jgi:hypothetical protein
MTEVTLRVAAAQMSKSELIEWMRDQIGHLPVG